MRFLVALSALALFALVVACASATIDKNKLAEFGGPPPDFHNVDETYLQDAMWRLGHDTQDLDDAFHATGVDDAAREHRVISLLDDMASAAKQATAPGTRKSHKNVAMNIDKLVTDINAAKTAAVSHDLAPAQAIPATCLACHEGAGGGAQKK
jgi:hypothetical protein